MSETGTDATLEGKRAAITAKLEALRVSPQVAELVTTAGAAVSKFKSEAAELEGQLADLDRETGARARQQRAEAEQRRQDEWQSCRKALIAEHEVRLQTIGDCERAARALLDALNRTLASNARMQKLAQQLSVTGKIPSCLSALEFASRLGGRLAGLLSTVKGHRRLGSIEWSGGSLYPPDRNWVEDEERQVSLQLLQPLLTKGKA